MFSYIHVRDYAQNALFNDSPTAASNP